MFDATCVRIFFENLSLAGFVCGYFQSGHAVELDVVLAWLTVNKMTRTDFGKMVQRNWEDVVARQTENAGKNNVEGRSFHCTGSRVVSHS